MFFKYTITIISLLFIFSFIETTNRELIFVIDKKSDQENVVVDMIKKINHQKENIIKSVFIVFYTCSRNFEVMFYYDTFKNFIGLEDNKIRNEYRKAKNIFIDHNLYTLSSFVCHRKNLKCLDFMLIVKNDFYKKFSILDEIEYRNNEILKNITLQFRMIINLYINYKVQINVICASDYNEISSLQDQNRDSLNLESSLNDNLSYNYNETTVLYTLVTKTNFIEDYKYKYEDLIKKIIAALEKNKWEIQYEASELLKSWLCKRNYMKLEKLIYLLNFILFEVQDKISYQNFFERNKSNEYIKILFYHECFGLGFPFKNVKDNFFKIRTKLEKAGIKIKIYKEIGVKKYYDILHNSLENYNNKKFLSVINIFFEQIKDYENELDKTEIEYLFKKFSCLFIESYALSEKKIFVFAAFCIKNETIFKKLAIQYLMFQNKKLVNFELNINEKSSIDFALYMLEVKKYFAKDNEVDNWGKIHIFKKIREIQKTKTIVKIECISSKEDVEKVFSKYSKNFNYCIKLLYYKIKSKNISETKPTIQCQFCKNYIVNIQLTTIKVIDRCSNCIKNNFSCFDICDNCIQKPLAIKFNTLIKKICCAHRFTEFLERFSFEIDLEIFIQHNYIYFFDQLQRNSMTIKYYKNLEVLSEYNNIDQFSNEYLIEDKKATLYVVIDSLQFIIKFDPRTTDNNILFLLFDNKKIQEEKDSEDNVCDICYLWSKNLNFNCNNQNPTCTHITCRSCAEKMLKLTKDNICCCCRRSMKIVS